MKSSRLQLAGLGTILVCFTLGGIFSVELTRFGTWLFLLPAVMAVQYIQTTLLSEKSPSTVMKIMGSVGGIGVMVMIGTQFALPFREYVLALGVGLWVPLLYTVLKQHFNR